MIESALALLALSVFGFFWLSTQSWFDLLPRRVTRRIGMVGLVICGFAAYFAPTSFEAGLQRWVNHAVERAQEKTQDMLEGTFDGLTTVPTPSPPPADPAPGSGPAPPPAA